MANTMSNDERTQAYMAQSGRKELTPKQRRRQRKKENKARGRK